MSSDYESQLQAEGETWSQNAEAYHGQHIPDYRELIKLDDYWLLLPWFKHVLSQLRPGSRVLELGCGAGWFSVEMARRGAHVLALDVAAGALDLARHYFGDLQTRERIPGQIEYRLADVNTCELPPQSFDWVIMFGMLHHAPNPEKLLLRAAGWLRTDGTLCVLDPLDAPRSNSLLIGGLMLVLPTKLGYAEKFRHLLRLRGQAVGRMTIAVEGRDLSPFEGVGRTAEPRKVVARVMNIRSYSEGFGLTAFLSREIKAPRPVSRALIIMIRPLEWLLRRLGFIRGLRYFLLAVPPILKT